MAECKHYWVKVRTESVGRGWARILMKCTKCGAHKLITVDK